MDPLEPVLSAIGEATAHGIGRIVRRNFALDAKQSQRIGEYVVIGAVAGAAVAVTLLFS
ncbi:MAG: hypothetical protein KDG52_11835 [Rhodocyclaceae bacterium]|nr:hypothetical protein [Rhodocyclaceae bacterium]